MRRPQFLRTSLAAAGAYALGGPRLRARGADVLVRAMLAADQVRGLD